MKSKISLLVAICFALLLFPNGLGSLADKSKNPPNTYSVSANISGADILVDGELSGKVTPAKVDADSVDAITVSLRGYTAAYSADGTTVTAELTPELVPLGSSSRKITVTTEADSEDPLDGLISLREAVALAMADTSEDWIVIDFADDVNTLSIDYSIVINKRGRITIDGGGDVTVPPCGWEGSIKPLAANLRFANLFFDGIQNGTCLSLRPVGNEVAAMHIDELHILGCTFLNHWEVGVTTCVSYGCGGTAYGSDYTVNYKNLTFSGNTFNRTRLFSFAAAGDGDYNVIDGYYILANRFIDGGIGMLAGDAHTQYVFGDPRMGYCEYNILKNVLVSGNTITMTENTLAVYESLIGVGTANLGNSNNLVEYVEIRNNITRIEGGESNMLSAIGICNAAVHDTVNAERTHHTDNNIMRYVSIHDNDFELGGGREFSVNNVNAGEGYQYGSNNTMEHIEIYGNSIKASHGVMITNFYKQSKSADCLNNNMSDIRFEDNRLSATEENYWDVGLLVAGTSIGNHGQTAVAYPNYSGEFCNVTVKGNEISGYGCGILCAASAGDYGSGASISDVTIEDNDITTANYNPYPEMDVGIMVAASALQTHSDPNNTSESPFQPSNRNCSVDDVAVKNNTIHARLGIMVCANQIDNLGEGVSTGNSVNGVEISGNSVVLRTPDTGEESLNFPAILLASAVDCWDRLAGAVSDASVDYSASEYLSGNVVTAAVLSNNSISGFSIGEMSLNNPLTAAAADWDLLGGGLYRLRSNPSNLGGIYLYSNTPLPTSTPTPTPTPTPTVGSIRGDANNSGSVDAADASHILRHIVRLVAESEINLAMSDVNDSGDVTAADASIILRWIVRLELTL